MDKTITIDGTDYTYTDDTPFVVDVATERGKWARRYTCAGKPSQAVFTYNGINIGNGYRKRLSVIVNGKRKTIARDAS